MDNPLSHHEIARRTTSGSFYKLSAQAVTLLLGFARAVLLARILSPADFGLVALALFFTQIGASFAGFGLNAAFIQKDTTSEEDIETHFILRAVFSFIVLVLITLLSPVIIHFYPLRQNLVPILMTLSVIETIKALSSTPIVLLTRQLQFLRLALIDIASSALMLLSAVSLAWWGWGSWSLVIGEHLTGALVTVLGIWVIRPPWKPSLRFNRNTAREYLSFGKYILVNSQLDTFLDQFDDFWTASILGSTAAGFYTKAYEFARYPRRVIVAPLQTVFYASFARLKNDRPELSTAFFQISAFIVRTGFLVSLILVIAAPEIISLLLTQKWLPILTTFRLLVVYTLLDPLFQTGGNLLMAVGQPRLITRIKIFQLIVFIPLVILFAQKWGISGVAASADVMMIFGTLLTLWNVKSYTDFSIFKVLAFPSLALITGAISCSLLIEHISHADILPTLILKIATSGITYLIVLFLFEPHLYRQLRTTLADLIRKN